jgi:hypothetical protein
MKTIRSLSLFLIISTLIFIISPALSEESTSLEKAINAAKAAKEAAKAADEARKSVIKAANAAEQAAKQAEEAAYQAYLLNRKLVRNERIKELPKPDKVPLIDLKVNNDIDLFIADKWPKGSEPILCDDFTFVRRLYLDVIGRIPSATEAESFIQDSSKDKRSKLIDELLNRNEEYAIHWSQFWEDALCSNGKHQGGVGTRSNFQKYIIESFKENKPYDVFVAQLLDPNVPKYNGGYVKSDTHLASIQTAANVGQVFLSTKMKCASCHDHFLNLDWTQKRFLGFASYFSENDLQVIRCEVKHDEFIKPTFIYENGSSENQTYSSLNERLADVTQLLTDPANPQFATTFVNRLWKRYLGLAFVEPVDDFKEGNDPSHPKLLEWLTYEFVTHHYDIKHMVRLILNSRTYQLKFDAQLADRFELGREFPRYFRSPSHRRLTCEQFLDSMQLALGIDAKRASFDFNSTGLTRSLGRPETRNEAMTTRPEDTAVIQALEFINGPHLHALLDQATLPGELSETENRKKAIESAFLIMLTRYPTEQEFVITSDYLSHGANQTDWEDLLWGLMIAPEFQYIR